MFMWVGGKLKIKSQKLSNTDISDIPELAVRFRLYHSVPNKHQQGWHKLTH